MSYPDRTGPHRKQQQATQKPKSKSRLALETTSPVGRNLEPVGADSTPSPPIHLGLQPLTGPMCQPRKHPLERRWSMWYFKNDKLNSGEVGCDYSMFKEGIEPMWEDPANVRCGRWLINLARQQRAVDLDNYWRDALLCLIGEAFDPHVDNVCGAVVNVRPKGDKIAIWTADAENHESNMKIGKTMRMEMEVPRAIPIGFQPHNDTITKSGSTTRNKFTA